jgi:hypothetical protein
MYAGAIAGGGKWGGLLDAIVIEASCAIICVFVSIKRSILASAFTIASANVTVVSSPELLSSNSSVVISAPY